MLWAAGPPSHWWHPRSGVGVLQSCPNTRASKVEVFFPQFPFTFGGGLLPGATWTEREGHQVEKGQKLAVKRAWVNTLKIKSSQGGKVGIGVGDTSGALAN